MSRLGFFGHPQLMHTTLWITMPKKSGDAGYYRGLATPGAPKNEASAAKRVQKREQRLMPVRFGDKLVKAAQFGPVLVRLVGARRHGDQHRPLSVVLP